MKSSLVPDLTKTGTEGLLGIIIIHVNIIFIIMPAWDGGVHQAVVLDEMEARLWESCALVVTTTGAGLRNLERERFFRNFLKPKRTCCQQVWNLAGRHRQPVAGEGLLVLEVPLEAALHVLHRKSAHRAAQDRVAWGRKHPVKYPGNGEN